METVHLNFTEDFNGTDYLSNFTQDVDLPNITGEVTVLPSRCPPPPQQAIVFYTVFFPVFVIGLVGNSLLLVMFARHKSLRTPPNTLILNLAVSDILTVVFCALGPTIHPPFNPPRVICIFLRLVLESSVHTTSFTLAALSAERYLAIVHPLKFHPGSNLSPKGFVLKAILLTWTGSVILATIKTSISSENKCERCLQMYVPDLSENIYALLLFLVTYPIPVVVIAIFYLLMAKHLYFKNKTLTEESKSQPLQTRKRIAFKVLVLVIVYVFCFFPKNFFSLKIYFGNGRSHDTSVTPLKSVLYCFGCLHTALSPIMLYTLSNTIREHFNRLLFSCFSKSSTTVEQSNPKCQCKGSCKRCSFTTSTKSISFFKLRF